MPQASNYWPERPMSKRKITDDCVKGGNYSCLRPVLRWSIIAGTGKTLKQIIPNSLTPHRCLQNPNRPPVLRCSTKGMEK